MNIFSVRSSLENTLLKERQRDDKDEDDVGINQINLKKKEYSENWTTRQQIDLCGELAFAWTTDRTEVTQRTEWMYLLILYDTTERTGYVGRMDCHKLHTFCSLRYQAIIIIEEVERKSNCIKTR